MNNIPPELIQEKLISAFKKHGPNAVAAVRQIMKNKEVMRDFIVPSNELFFQADANEGIMTSFSNVAQGSGIVASMHINAIKQIAEKMDISQGYAAKLASAPELWKNQLVAYLLQRHVENSPAKNLLVRCLGNEVRGILSDKYRRMDMGPIFIGFADAAQSAGALMYDGYCGDLNGFLEVMLPTPYEVTTPNNGTVHMAFGAQVSSSDFGHGSLQVQGLAMQVWCTNMMTRSVGFSKVHLGKRLEADNIVFSEETVRLDTAAKTSAIRDLVKQVLDKESIRAEIGRIQMASSKTIDMKREIKELPKLGLTREEADMVERFMLESDPEAGVQGKPTVWKLQQAITASARAYSPLRFREMAVIAGNL